MGADCGCSGPAGKQPDRLSLRPGQPRLAVATGNRLGHCSGTQPGRASGWRASRDMEGNSAGPGRGAAVQLTRRSRAPEGVHLRTPCSLNWPAGPSAVLRAGSCGPPPIASGSLQVVSDHVAAWGHGHSFPSAGSVGPFLPRRQEAVLRQALGNHFKGFLPCDSLVVLKMWENNVTWFILPFLIRMLFLKCDRFQNN